MPQARSALFAARPLISAALALLLAGGMLPGPTVAADGAARPVPEPAGFGIGSSVGIGRRGRAGRGPPDARHRSRGDPRRGRAAPLDRLRAGDGARGRHDRVQARRAGDRRLPAARDGRLARRQPAADRPAGGPRDGRRDGEEPAGQRLDDPRRVRRRGQATMPRSPTAPRRPSTRPAVRRSTRAAPPTSPRSRTTWTSRPRGASVARCSASCPTGSCPAPSASSTTTCSRRSPTSRWASTASATCARRTATAPTPPAGAVGRARA